MTSLISLSAQDWIHIFEEIAERVEKIRDHLNDLDGVIGDGDHGLTMVVGMRAVRQAVSILPPSATMDQVFTLAGNGFANAAGGAIGPLLGGMWTACGKRFLGCLGLDAVGLRAMFECMEETIIRKGKVNLGDKTLLDALHPAVQIVISDTENDMACTLRRAARAAAEGARSTAPMVSRVGRSSRLGDRTIGHEDAGANSMALIIEAMADVATNCGRKGTILDSVNRTR